MKIYIEKIKKIGDKNEEKLQISQNRNYIWDITV